MIRVLIVDNSARGRQLVRSVLENDPALWVVGETSSGDGVVALCRALEPDIVTLGLDRLATDGYWMIRQIMVASPRPIVVLTGAGSDHEPDVASRAIELGALSVVRKPEELPGADPRADRLIESVKAMADVKVVGRRPWLLESPDPGSSHHRTTLSELDGGAPARASRRSVRLLAMGASTGGPPALQMILKALPPDLAVPVVVVQHMSPGFVGGLARWLDQTTPCRVKVGEDGEHLWPGTVYLAPDGRHLLVRAGKLICPADAAPVDGHCPSVTVLFEALAESLGPGTVGVLLTGMGGDGARGLQALRRAGGHTIVQDEESCVIFGMPRQAIALGAAREVLPLERIGARLAELADAQGRWDDDRE
jgi:two-component system chemotaxis response regulator CheB